MPRDEVRGRRLAVQLGGFLRFLVPPAPNIRPRDADSACAAELQRRTARVARPGHVRVRLSRSASVKSKGSRVPRPSSTVGRDEASPG